MYRPRGGVGTEDRYLHDVAYNSIMIKMSYVLVTQGEQENDVPSEADVMAAMPTASELLAMGDTGNKHLSGQLNYASTPLVLAEVCERYGAYDRAIDLATLALPSADQVAKYNYPAPGDATGAGASATNSNEKTAAAGVDEDATGKRARARRFGYDVRPSAHISAGTIIGRCLARQRKLKEATDAFETAIHLAERYGYKLLQLFGKPNARALVYPRAPETRTT
jgi:tetratricopeptide (TPR) repeat protein